MLIKAIVCCLLAWWLIIIPSVLLIAFTDDIADLIRAKAEELRERAEKIRKEKNND